MSSYSSFYRSICILVLLLGLAGCNSEEYAKEKRERAVKDLMSSLGISFSSLSQISDYAEITSLQQDSTAIDLSTSAYKAFEDVEGNRKEFEQMLKNRKMNPGENEITLSSLNPVEMAKYSILLKKIEKFAHAYQSLVEYSKTFQKGNGRCITALLNDWAYMDRYKFSWVFYFDEKNNLKSYRNYGHNTKFLLEKKLNTKTFIDLIESRNFKMRNTDSTNLLTFANNLTLDSISFIYVVDKSDEVDQPHSKQIPVSKSFIGRSYYNLTIGQSLYSSTIKKFNNNGFKILHYTLGNNIQMYACVKKYKWNNINWDELDLYFKDNILVGIAFAIACNSETKAKHYLERVSNIYKEKYKQVITDSSSDFLYFDDGNTAMEIYGGTETMYLRICDTDIADDL